MKKTIRTGLILLVMMISFVAMLNVGAVDAQAAKKKPKKTTQASTDETLNALNAYLNALIKMGGSAEDIAVAQQAVAARQAQLDLLAANAEAVAASQGVIFVGDSRTVQMQGAVGLSAAKFIAENSKGYAWFKDVAIPMIDANVGKGSKIVINLGVNDPGNIDNYIALVNAKAFEWNAKGAKVYYATVNPVSENPYTSQTQVDYFNSKLLPGLVGVGIIDTNTFLKTNGYALVDGLHFTDATYVKLYHYILSNI